MPDVYLMQKQHFRLEEDCYFWMRNEDGLISDDYLSKFFSDYVFPSDRITYKKVGEDSVISEIELAVSEDPVYSLKLVTWAHNLVPCFVLGEFE